jgi:excisionase family DNA binding protein
MTTKRSSAGGRTRRVTPLDPNPAKGRKVAERLSNILAKIELELAQEEVNARPIEQFAYSVPHAARMIDLSVRKMWDLVRTKEIQSYRIGRTRRISHEALMAYLHKRAGESEGLRNIEQAAAWLGIPKKSLYNLTAARAVPFTKVGRHIRFSQEHLDAIVAAGSQPVIEAPFVSAPAGDTACSVDTFSRRPLREKARVCRPATS